MFLRSVDYSRTLNALYKGESAAQEAIVSLTGFLDLLPMVLERNAVPLDGTLFELLERIMEPYEYVVIDASSVGRSSDVLRLNKLANNVLFVVRYDATPRPLCRMPLKSWINPVCVCWAVWSMRRSLWGPSSSIRSALQFRTH